MEVEQAHAVKPVDEAAPMSAAPDASRAMQALEDELAIEDVIT